MRNISSNQISGLLIILAVITHYCDIFLNVPAERSISFGLLSAGFALLKMNVNGQRD